MKKASWSSFSIAEVAQKVQRGDISALSLVEECLERIQEFNPTYEAIIAVLDKPAKERAGQIDARIKAGEAIGPLAGIPFIAKDNFLVFGAETTAASNMLRGFTAPYQASVVEKLEAAGAICIAKANLDAFAHGSSTENSDYMVTKNPHDTTRVAGGSSGGSAVSVALELAPFALGTDTGGSIRLPASYCGVVGYKPTYGLVSRSGVVAMASSTDVIGPFARTIDDSAYVLDVMAGKDPLDSTTINRDDVPYTTRDNSLKGKKIGKISEYFGEGLRPEVKVHLENLIDNMKQAGAEVVDVSLPSLPLALAVYYIVVPAEVSSNLSRYDGQRFQFSDPTAKDLQESYDFSRSRGFGAEAKRRIMTGTYVLSSGYYDAYYKKAQTVRTKLIYEFQEVFSEVDFLIGPTAPSTAFKIGEHTEDPLQMYLTDIMTVAVNLVGIPSVSLPVGTVENLPVGLQVMAPQRADRALLGLAEGIEELVP